MSLHRPRRPQWTCVVDGDTWPCGPLRQLLLDHYGQNPEDAARQMLHLLAREHANELLGAAPAKLYGRFVRWALPEGTRCRVCGRSGHDVLPDLPPRLFPCDGRVIPPLREPGDGQGPALTGDEHNDRALSIVDDVPN